MSGIFVDTGAWFARFVPTDPDHPAAKSVARPQHVAADHDRLHRR